MIDQLMPGVSVLEYTQGCLENLGGLGHSVEMEPFTKLTSYIVNDLVIIVQSTISMRSMLMLGGSGGMPPQENFEK